MITRPACIFDRGITENQNIDGVERPIAFASKGLNKAECNYSTTQREALAMVWGTKHFDCYLYGREFTLVSDHNPLRWLQNVKDTRSMLARWALLMSTYKCTTVYRKGAQHGNADGLSRRPHGAGTVLACALATPRSILKHLSPSPSQRVKKSVRFKADLVEDIPDRATDPSQRVAIAQVETRAGGARRLAEEQLPKPALPELQDSEITLEDFRRQQHLDEVCIRIRRRKNGDKSAAVPKGARLVDFITYDGLLYHRSRNGHRLRIIVPGTLRLAVLELYHDCKISGHLGYQKTLSRLLPRFYWPNLFKDVRQYVKSCLVCQQHKGPSRGKAPLIPIPVGGAFERLGVDILGEFHFRRNGEIVS